MAKPRLPPQNGAWKKGYKARLAGEPRTACPYKDERTWRGAITFSRTFIVAWRQGWNQADRDLEIVPEPSRCCRDHDCRSPYWDKNQGCKQCGAVCTGCPMAEHAWQPGGSIDGRKR